MNESPNKFFKKRREEIIDLGNKKLIKGQLQSQHFKMKSEIKHM